jgi:phage gpG-like protein
MASGLVEAKWSPPLKVEAAYINRLGADIRSFREPITKAIKQVIIPSIRKNFDAGGRPAWPPYSENTIEFRAMMGESSKSLLVKSGKLRATMGYFSIWTVNQTAGELTNIPSSIWYGNLHQGGYGGQAKPLGGLVRLPGGKTKQAHWAATIPARPFVMYQSEDEEDIVKIFEKWLEERIDRAWPGGVDV